MPVAQHIELFALETNHQDPHDHGMEDEAHNDHGVQKAGGHRVHENLRGSMQGPARHRILLGPAMSPGGGWRCQAVCRPRSCVFASARRGRCRGRRRPRVPRRHTRGVGGQRDLNPYVTAGALLHILLGRLLDDGQLSLPRQSPSSELRPLPPEPWSQPQADAILADEGKDRHDEERRGHECQTHEDFNLIGPNGPVDRKDAV
mmetsp:Transcript_57227/g.133832  ORF Transcript_57227/g.133832 Transcript_57227/m.133832 type:complete len:203 (-) Transcript_57227:1012-1620(-)